MCIPKKVFICGQEFSIIFKKDLMGSNNEKLLGLCDVNRCTIFLERGMEKQKEQEVFLHECLHAIADNMALKLKESEINILAIQLLSFIKANKLNFNRK